MIYIQFSKFCNFIIYRSKFLLCFQIKRLKSKALKKFKMSSRASSGQLFCLPGGSISRDLIAERKYESRIDQFVCDLEISGFQGLEPRDNSLLRRAYVFHKNRRFPGIFRRRKNSHQKCS